MKRIGWAVMTVLALIIAAYAIALLFVPAMRAPFLQQLSTHVGFGLLAVLWLFATAMAYRYIRARDQVSHRRWMIRSYALTFAAVTLRIYLPLSQVAGIPFDAAYQTISWLCWVPNLIVAEWIILQHRQGESIHQPHSVPPP